MVGGAILSPRVVSALDYNVPIDHEQNASDAGPAELLAEIGDDHELLMTVVFFVRFLLWSRWLPIERTPET